MDYLVPVLPALHQLPSCLSFLFAILLISLALHHAFLGVQPFFLLATSSTMDYPVFAGLNQPTALHY